MSLETTFLFSNMSLLETCYSEYVPHGDILHMCTPSRGPQYSIHACTCSEIMPFDLEHDKILGYM
jgi:hypothetical protein